MYINRYTVQYTLSVYPGQRPPTSASFLPLNLVVLGPSEGPSSLGPYRVLVLDLNLSSSLPLGFLPCRITSVSLTLRVGPLLSSTRTVDHRPRGTSRNSRSDPGLSDLVGSVRTYPSGSRDETGSQRGRESNDPSQTANPPLWPVQVGIRGRRVKE